MIFFGRFGKQSHQRFSEVGNFPAPSSIGSTEDARSRLSSAGQAKEEALAKENPPDCALKAVCNRLPSQHWGQCRHQQVWACTGLSLILESPLSNCNSEFRA